MELKAIAGMQKTDGIAKSNKTQSKPDEEMKDLFSGQLAQGKPLPAEGPNGVQAKPLPVEGPTEKPGDDDAIIAFKKIREQNTASFDLDKKSAA